MALARYGSHKKPVFGCTECFKAADQMMTDGSWRCGCPFGIDTRTISESYCSICGRRRPKISERDVRDQPCRVGPVNQKQMKLL